MLLENVFEIYEVNLISKERSKETIRGYNAVLMDFKRYVETLFNGLVYINEIEEGHLEAYLEYRKNKGDQPVSRNRTIYIFRSLYSFLVKKELVNNDISKKLEVIKFYRKERTYLNSEEIETFINEIEHPVIKTAVITLALTGLRVSELTNLNLEDVDLYSKVINVREGKGKKNRKVPINIRLYEVLSNYLLKIRSERESVYFFATRKSGKLSPAYINYYLRATVQKLGWTKQVTAHIFRHSFASNLVLKQVSLSVIQNLLGHSDLRVTGIYLHQSMEQLKEAVDLI